MGKEVQKIALQTLSNFARVRGVHQPDLRNDTLLPKSLPFKALLFKTPRARAHKVKSSLVLFL